MRVLLLGVVLWGVAGTAWGQASGARAGAFDRVGETGAVAPDATVGAALRSLAAKASDVFVGQVIAITRKGGVVEVRFRVDQAVVGSAGGEYLLREWAGLWPEGMARYYVGQRAMVFVAPTGAAGLSTTVDGAEGVVPVMLGEEPLLDVERLEARVLRAQGEALVDEETGAVRVSDAVAIVSGKKLLREPRRLPVPVKFRRLRGVRGLVPTEMVEVEHAR